MRRDATPKLPYLEASFLLLLGIGIIACDRGKETSHEVTHDSTDAVLGCDELASKRSVLEVEYSDALKNDNYAEASEIGGDVRAIVEQQLAHVTQCELDFCVEICHFHPCDIDSCEQQCSAFMHEYADSHMVDILLDSASTPGLCTCDVCPAEAFDFCFDLWGCRGPDIEPTT